MKHEAKLISFLRRTGGSTAPLVASHLNVSYSTARKALETLVSAGKVIKEVDKDKRLGWGDHRDNLDTKIASYRLNPTHEALTFAHDTGEQAGPKTCPRCGGTYYGQTVLDTHMRDFCPPPQDQVIAEIKSAPMITVPPPTPITAEDKLGWAINDLDRAIFHYQQSNLHHTPLWAALHDAKRHIQEALTK